MGLDPNRKNFNFKFPYNFLTPLKILGMRVFVVYE